MWGEHDNFNCNYISARGSWPCPQLHLKSAVRSYPHTPACRATNLSAYLCDLLLEALLHNSDSHKTLVPRESTTLKYWGLSYDLFMDSQSIAEKHQTTATALEPIFTWNYFPCICVQRLYMPASSLNAVTYLPVWPYLIQKYGNTPVTADVESLELIGQVIYYNL